MLKSAYTLLGLPVAGTDGKAGTVHDLIFDRQSWQIEQIIVDTGNILPGRKVIVRPTSIDRLKPSDLQLWVGLSLDEIEHSPSLQESYSERGFAKSVEPQQELPLQKLGGGLFQEQTIGMQPDSIVEMIRAEEEVQRQTVVNAPQEMPANSHSVKETIGAYLVATDGEFGHIEDLLLDEQIWRVEQVVIDRQNWLPGKKVQLEPRWIESLDPADNKVYVRLSQTDIDELPEARLAD